MKYVNRMLSDLPQAEDIAQETMLRAWRQIDQLAPERGSIWGWLCRVAHNIMVDRIRYRRARPTEVQQSPAPAATQVVADHSSGVVDSLYLARAMAQLSPARRAVLHLVYYRDHTCAEAAAVLGIPVGTVKSRLHYALRQLRDTLGPERGAGR